MKLSCLRIAGVVAVLALSGVCSSIGAQGGGQAPDAATRKTIEQKMAKLGDLLGSLRAKGPAEAKVEKILDVLTADIEIYHQAARWIVGQNEFFQKESAAWTVEALDRGLERAGQALEGKFDWLKTPGRTIVRGYRSAIDGSIQPYAVTLPEDYLESRKKYRLDVVLHGRDNNLNEIKFLHQFGDKPAPADLSYVKIDIFGRGNNAYRWAGEVDVLEAKANFELFEEMLGRGRAIDKQRQVLRGFSMGGAGAWHIGLHHPGMWCVIGPGAGFTTTHGYVKNLSDNLGWPEEQCLRIYDAVAYAENAFEVPIVAYAGEKDAQLQAAKSIEAALKPTQLQVQMQILIAPGLEHKFPAEWQQKAEQAYAPFIKKGRPEYPERVRFVTYTSKYGTCDWVEVIGMGKHYDKAVVDAQKTEDGFKVTTSNVTILRLRVPKGDLFDMAVVIDGQKVTARPWDVKGGDFHVYLQNRDGQWTATMPQKLTLEQLRNPRKVSHLQGPIDDAFTVPFLCIRATGQPWSDRVDDYAAASLKRFQGEWAKYMRGDLPVKNDVDVTGEDITDKNLILFGDPGSNLFLATILEGLPLEWTKEKLTLAGKTFAAQTHAPLLIYPNPLNPMRYVVVNSGHTFHADDFKGTNALLYPRYGDYAILGLAEKGPVLAVGQVKLNGLFDDSWKVMPGK